MTFIAKLSKAAVALTLGMTLASGCDMSKQALDDANKKLADKDAELNRVKGDLAKAQTDATNREAELNAKLAELTKTKTALDGCAPATTALQACANPGAAPAVEPAAPAGKTAAKPAAHKAPAAKAAPAVPVNPAAPAGSKENPKQLAGPRGSEY